MFVSELPQAVCDIFAGNLDHSFLADHPSSSLLLRRLATLTASAKLAGIERPVR